MEKLAIIGTGISGMSSAYFLKDLYDITVFEKNDYIGGHTNTVCVDEDGQDIWFDTGFMVFNEVTYPYLIKLFRDLGVEYTNTDMSFAVRHDPADFEFNGSGVMGLFSQRKNLFRPRFLKMLYDINRFNSDAIKVLDDDEMGNMTLEAYLRHFGYGNDMRDRYLIPMSSAVWSTPHEKMLNFPIKTLVRFFYNHGFLGLNTQHQWKTVVGGSRKYRDLLIKNFREKIQTNSPVEEVSIEENKIHLLVNGKKQLFDKVIFACHSDEALKIRGKDVTKFEKEVLSCFKYQKNIAVIHNDESVMPKLKRTWSSWNYISRLNEKRILEHYTVYYMNSLQHLESKKNYFININGSRFVNPKKIIKTIDYDHPVFDEQAIKSQPLLDKLNEDSIPVYYCGAYYRYGFHEDGLLSSVNLCSKLIGKEVL